MVVQKPKSILKVSSMVVEMEIAPKRKPETYTQEIQCEIIDAKKLGKIAEESEDDSDEFDQRFNNMMSRAGPARNKSGSVSSRRDSVTTGIVEAKRPSNANMNFNKAPEAADEVKEMSKDEAKQVMATADF